MKKEKYIYFVSDVHLGLQSDPTERLEHQQRFVEWLDEISKTASRIYLLGDIFDFWFEFNNSYPKGYEAVLSKLKECTDKGIEIHFFVGNHDMWSCGHLSRLTGATLHTQPELVELYGRRIILGHGHNLNTDKGFWLGVMNSIFTSKCIYAAARVVIPKSLMNLIGTKWSRSSRSNKAISHPFRNEGESVVKYLRGQFVNTTFDLAVFGHIHTPTIYPLYDGVTLYILGEWLTNPQIGRLDSTGDFELIRAL